MGHVVCSTQNLTQSNLTAAQESQIKQLFLAGGVSFNAAKDSKEASRRRATNAVLWLKRQEDVEDQPTFDTVSVESCQLPR